VCNPMQTEFPSIDYFALWQAAILPRSAALAPAARRSTVSSPDIRQ